MSLSAAELSKLQIANPDTDDTTDTKLEERLGYLKRMQELGFMDQSGRWTDKGIQECIK